MKLWKVSWFYEYKSDKNWRKEQGYSTHILKSSAEEVKRRWNIERPYLKVTIEEITMKREET